LRRKAGGEKCAGFGSELRYIVADQNHRISSEFHPSYTYNYLTALT
jgi:hypothetical protein